MAEIFTIEGLRPIRDDMTISRDSKLSQVNKVTYFSLGAGTSISQEAYDHFTMYLGAKGFGRFIIGKDKKEIKLQAGEALIVPPNTLCGVVADEGLIYTEIIFNKEIKMNSKVKANEVFQLKDLIDYEEGSVVNLDVASNAATKYVLMAFDEGTGLSAHRAPGQAIVFALEGKAIITYENVDYEISEGQCFKFEKDGLHAVTAKGKFKMALLLALE